MSHLKLKEAFSKIVLNGGQIVIPPEIPPIFERMIDAFSEIDIVAIDEEVENLDALNLSGALKEEIEQIKDMVMMMNYDGATEHTKGLLNDISHL